jgi:outer membrane protein OmpA-like peptidoglycan-associated protein
MMKFIQICLALICFSFTTYSQTNSYYVVIGAFSVEANAARHQTRANQLNIPATHVFNPEHKLFYVFVRDTENKGDAYATLLSMQQEGFNDAWVYRGNLDASIAFKNSHQSGTGLTTTETVEETSKPEPEQSNQIEAPVQTVSQTLTDPTPVSSETANVNVAPKPAGKPLIFSVINAVTGKPVTGQVHLLESDRAKQYQGVSSNEVVSVVPPKNKTGRWYLACYVIGYEPVKNSFLYSNPQKTPGASVGPNQEVMIPLVLERVKRGDYIEMDNVKFFGNSAVFTPESERELTELLAMMEENPDYKIKVHGHVNGNPQGEIIARSDSPNFFALDEGNKHIEGDAKQLSTWRAEAVRDFLVSKGIDASRISVKGESNKQPIFDPKGTNAVGNDRVEVEITKS